VSATASERLAQYVHGLRFEDLPPDVVAKAKDHIAYHFVHALLGHRVAEGTQAVAIARGLSEGGGDATIIGSGIRALPIDAAFANTTLMRAPGMDDVLFPLGVHAALVTLPGALALAERHGRSGPDLITAVVAGYDAIGTIGKGIQPWAAREPRRPTIPFGPFGGSVSCALILGLDVPQIANAIGYAAHSAMGLAVESGEWQHYYGLVTRNGIMAATVAQAGGLVSREILEAPYGFFETFFGSVPEDIDATIAHVGRTHEILNATTKRYPGTGANMVSIENLRAIVRDLGLGPADIARIDVVLPTVREKFTDGHSLPPYRAGHASSSVYFQMAIVAVDGGRSDFARYQQPNVPEITEMIGRIHTSFEPGHGNLRYSRMRVELADGRVIEREGETYTFPPIDVHDELARAARGLLADGAVARGADMLVALDEVADVRELMRAFRA
jgi:2-methylcitrate dehydratase PrpD